MQPEDDVRLAQAEDRKELLRLLEAPREQLNIEIKGWLDLKDEIGRADLAKAIIAIANHGGGRVLLGWTEGGGRWIPEEPQPDDLSGYSQDCINGIVASYAEPSFHCEVHHIIGSSENSYPLIRVPGRHRVPIRTKRDDPARKHIRINTYYVRRPGPASESPQTGREWDELIRRCLISAREELLDDFRNILRGQPSSGILLTEGDGQRAVRNEERTEKQQLENSVEEWFSESFQKWKARVVNELKESPSRYSYGTWSIAYVVGGEFRRPSLGELRDILVNAERNETGWPLWLVPTDEDIKPHPANGLIECWILGDTFQDGAHSDFWRASPRGYLFNIRGYAEDAYKQLSPESQVEPGTVFDVTIPIWRAAEALLHANQMAEILVKQPVPIAIKSQWDGLEGRRLASLDWKRRWSVHPRVSKQDAVDSLIVVNSDEIISTLPEIVGRLTSPVYEVFDFFSPTREFIEGEIRNFKGARTRRIPH